MYETLIFKLQQYIHLSKSPRLRGATHLVIIIPDDKKKKIILHKLLHNYHHSQGQGPTISITDRDFLCHLAASSLAAVAET